MAHVRRMLEAKFQRELVRSKRRQEFEDLDQQQRDRILSEHREQQKMLRLIVA